MNDIIRNFYLALVLVIDNFFQFYRPKTMELHKVLLEYEFFQILVDPFLVQLLDSVLRQSLQKLILEMYFFQISDFFLIDY